MQVSINSVVLRKLGTLFPGRERLRRGVKSDPPYTADVLAVAGWKIRDLEWNDDFIEFTNGGNPGRYDFILTDIWIDNDTGLHDLLPLVCHEHLEGCLMVGRGMRYADAHIHANQIERYVRRRRADWSHLNTGSAVCAAAEKILTYWAKEHRI